MYPATYVSYAAVTNNPPNLSGLQQQHKYYFSLIFFHFGYRLAVNQLHMFFTLGSGLKEQPYLEHAALVAGDKE